MSLRENLGNSVRDYGINGKKKSRVFTRAYDRFFEGYTEEAVLKPNGKGIKIRRVYKGEYYSVDLPSGKKSLLKLAYIILFLLSVFLFATGAVTPIAANSTWFVAAAQALCVPMLFWILFAFVSYLPAPRRMTIAEYKSSSVSLKRAAILSAVALSVLSLSMLVFILINLTTEETAAELICLVKYLFAAASSLLIFLIERKVKYKVEGANKKVSNAQV